MHGSARRLLVPALLVLLAGPGCSRKFFREQADKDVAGVITQKNVFPAWVVKNWFAYPHPDSRFADPYNPDRPPYPPDDYAARLLSPNPQHPTKKTGTGRVDGDGYMRLLQQWDAENRAGDANGDVARGAPPDRVVMPRPPYMNGGKPANPSPTRNPTPAPTVKANPPAPAAPPVAPPGFTASASWAPLAPGNTLPPPDTSSIVGPPRPAEPTAPIAPPAAITPPPAPVQAQDGKWTAVKPVVTLVTDPKPAPVGPTVAELRAPSVVVVGSSADEVKPVPAVAVEPVLNPPIVLPDLPPTTPPVLPNPAPAAPMTQPAPVVPAVPAAPVQPQPPAFPQPPEKLPNPPKPVDPPKADPKLPEPKPLTPSGQFPSVRDLLLGGGADDDYLRALQSNQVGYRIRTEQAVELGLVNSREFQDRREDLYLAALPVTLERYSFAAQAFFTEQVVRSYTGSGLSGAGKLWTAETDIGFGKRFATGGQLLVQFANQIIINVGQGRPDLAISTASLSFLQPLLRGGGFAVTLEDLTAAERNMLYAMRSYARFRKLFYVAISAGGNITNNPYGLQGLSVNLGRGIGGNLTAPAVGYLPLLQQAAVIANQQKNVNELQRLLRIYQAFGEGGQIPPIQVGQVEVQLLNSRGQLLGSAGQGGGGGIRGFLDSLDNFKLQLGLPVTVGLDLDNTPLRPIQEHLARFEDLYDDLRMLEEQALRYDRNAPPVQIRAHWRRLLTESELVKGTAFAKGIGARWDEWAKLTGPQLTARMEKLADERLKLLAARAEREAKKQPDVPAETKRLADVQSELALGEFERQWRNYEGKPWAKTPVPAGAPATEAEAFQNVYTAFYRVVAIGARTERVLATRADWPKLAPLPVDGADVLQTSLDEAYTAGIQAALSNRLDLMNARGQVVDAYRQIAVQANSLQGVLNVGYDASIASPSPGSQPFGFSSNRATNQLTIRGELPLVRRAERNNYRASLISYQRQRRTLMAFEDNIANDVRADIRELRTLAQLYRIQQRAVELGYEQVDSAQRTFFAPLAANAAFDAAQAAALTQQVLDAQSRLLTAQNQLYSLWVSYTTARMNLYLDLELMQLDDRGVWCDEQAAGPSNPPRPGPDGAPERVAPGGVVPASGRR